MRTIAIGVLSIVATMTACSEPSAPTEDVVAARKSVRQATAVALPFPGGGRATDINNRGQVTGEGDEVGLWYKGAYRRLGSLPGYDNISAEAINSSGAVVGWAVPEGQQGHAFLWDGDRMQDLGLLPGDVNSAAHAINAAGDVGGVSTATGGDMFAHAVLWRKGQIIPLGTLPGDAASEAFGIDNAGRVVGESRREGSPSTWRPFMWKNGVMTELTELEQPNVGFSYTRDGIVAWKCPDDARTAKAHRRVGVITYISCPTRSADEGFVDIEDINASGHAVGTLARGVREGDEFRWETHGYLWSGGERTLLPPVSGDPEIAIEPHAINDRGQIVGHSFVGATLWMTR